MGFFTEFRQNRRRSKAWDEAHGYGRSGNFAAAAEVYERLAAESLQYNELICPQCGGTLPFTYNDVSVTCPFCSSVIRAE